MEGFEGDLIAKEIDLFGLLVIGVALVYWEWCGLRCLETNDGRCPLGAAFTKSRFVVLLDCVRVLPILERTW